MSKVKNAEAAVDPAIEFFKAMDIVSVTPEKLKDVLKTNIVGGLPTGIWGIAGIGKTHIARQVADELDMDLIVFHLQHCEPEDIKGFPFPDPSDPTAVQMRLMKILPRVKSKRKGTILFLDEWNRGDKAVVNAVFPLMENPRKVGDFTLPEDVHIILAGNPSDGQYNVNEAEKEPAIRRRVCWVGLQFNQTSWINWAARSGVHISVIDYIKRHKDKFYDLEAHNAGRVGSNPATWEKVSTVIKTVERLKGGLKDNSSTLRTILSGLLGKKNATEFTQEILDNAEDLVTPEDILAGFEPGMEVYEKVTKLASGRGGDHGKLGLVASSLAATVIAEQRPPIAISTQLAAFAAMLPGDLFQKFQEELVKGLNDDSDKGRVLYLKTLSAALSKEPMYKEARTSATKKLAALNKAIED